MAKKKARPARKKARAKSNKDEAVVATAEAADLQAIMDQSVSDEVAGIKPVALGYELRPITLESIILLKQIDCPLILGVPMDDIENIFLDCCKFIVLHREDKPTARNLAWDEDSLLESALDFASEVKADKITELTDSVFALIRSSMDTRVEATPKKDDKPDPADLLGNE